jgi:glutamine synthetase
MSAETLLKIIQEKQISMVDCRFTDTYGVEQHVTVPASQINSHFFETGKMFDGSSIAGWKSINESDMMLLPDMTDSQLNAVVDPFCEEPTLILRCNVIEPSSMKHYDRCPRSIALRAEAYLKSTGIADTCNVGPEPEFFIFDDVRYTVSMNNISLFIDAEEAAWNSGRKFEGGNKGHRPSIKGGYFPTSPTDSYQDLRTQMCLTLEEMGIATEAHHHEVATAGQCEISTRFDSIVRKADQTQLLKYVVKNVAHSYGKTATFMPKPLVGDNGSGMHVHLSLVKNGENLFSGDRYAGLSDIALYFIGGIIKHARMLNAFTNPCTNSYKRLVPGFEAPVMLAYSSRNRSASIRIPFTAHPQGRRIEVRFPDAAANPYLAFSAMMMAGLDGIQTKTLPGDAFESDLYELSTEEAKSIPTVCSSLEEALIALDKNRECLTQSQVFSNSMIDAYIELKMKEVRRLQMTTHPVEFEMYYSV